MDFRTSNHILAALTAEDRSSLRPHLQTIDLPRETVLEAENTWPSHVYFLEDGLASVIALTPDGTQIEVGLYGREGMSGGALVHGTDQGPLRTFVQGAGSAQRISSEKLRVELAKSPTMFAAFLRWQQVFAIHVAHTALANGRYLLEARLARWLLMSQDRLGDELDLTHQFLGLMLGVRRAGVTTALHVLEGEHLIKATRGRIIVRDRAGLQARAGEAYGVPEAFYERVCGRPICASEAMNDQRGPRHWALRS
jgi:CRP-like cAMP-binding protein